MSEQTISAEQQKKMGDVIEVMFELAKRIASDIEVAKEGRQTITASRPKEEERLPEDLTHWLREAEDNYSHEKRDQDAYAAGAIDMYWKHCHNVENPTRLSFVKFAYSCMRERDELLIKQAEGEKSFAKWLDEMRDQKTWLWEDTDIWGKEGAFQKMCDRYLQLQFQNR